MSGNKCQTVTSPRWTNPTGVSSASTEFTGAPVRSYLPQRIGRGNQDLGHLLLYVTARHRFKPQHSFACGFLFFMIKSEITGRLVYLLVLHIALVGP